MPIISFDSKLMKKTWTVVLDMLPYTGTCSFCLWPQTIIFIFSARQHICYSALYAIARPSVPRVDQSNTVEVRIM